MKKKLVSQSGFPDSRFTIPFGSRPSATRSGPSGSRSEPVERHDSWFRRPGTWPFFSCTVLVSLYSLRMFPAATASAQNQNGGAASVFQAGAGEHVAWSGDALPGSRPTLVYPHAWSEVTRPGDLTPVTTPTSPGMVITPTFDSSITGNPNAAAIQAMINQAVAIYQARFSDPITVRILFRYSTTQPNGTPMGGSLARSNFVIYNIPWNTFINALTADARTGNDTIANGSLPGSPMSANIVPSSASGRAIGLNTAGTMDANGNVGSGIFDGIVTLNAGQPFQFNRPPSGNNYDALRSTEHEMDEVLGLGSLLNLGGTSNLRPQDLFSWSSPGTRNITSSGTRYFSINSGNNNIVGFNQDSGGDFGDWFSPPCPQANPYVQCAFSCPGQFSDVTATSPEGINLDVIGYDLGTSNPSPTPTATATATATPTATPPPSSTVLGNISTRLRVETGDNVLIGGFIVTGTQAKRVILRAIGPSLPLAGALSDPTLELRNSSGLIAFNDDWKRRPDGSSQEAEIAATGIPPTRDFESALVATLPAGGSGYTAIVRGFNNVTGIGVVEAYDLDRTVDSKLANISTRGFVSTGDNVMIGGTIIIGSNQARVLIRAIGPSLTNLGVPNALSDPTLELRDSNGALVAYNDDWKFIPGGGSQEAEIIATGIPPTADFESALVRNLAPAPYTAIVRGYQNLTGVALVEAYQLQ